MKDKKDFIIEALIQLNDDLRTKLVSLYVEAKTAAEAKQATEKRDGRPSRANTRGNHNGLPTERISE